MSAFIAFEPQAASKTARSSKASSKILFVDCNDGGKPSVQSKPRLNRHAAIRSLPARPDKSRSAALQEKSNQDQATNATTSVGPTTLRFKVNGKKASPLRRTKEKQRAEKEQDNGKALSRRAPDGVLVQRLPYDPRSARLISNTPFGAFQSPSPNVDNKLVSTIINWFFMGKDEAASRGTLQVATDHWMKQLWDWATTHEALFEGVVLNVMKKRLDIAGSDKTNQREYLQQKGEIIHRLRHTVENEGPELGSPTLFVIANMAIHAFQDGDARAARLHLEALEAIKAPRKIRSYEWVGVWIVDFRLALILGCRPAFSYYVPFHQDKVPQINEDVLQERVEESLVQLPQSKSKSYNEALYSLVRQLWKFYQAWPSLNASASEPFGMIYNLEYTLRTLHANLLLDHGDCEQCPQQSNNLISID